jgi:hypothetical protein
MAATGVLRRLAPAARATAVGPAAWAKPRPPAVPVRLTPEERRAARAMARGRPGTASALPAGGVRAKLPLLPLPQALQAVKAAARARFDETVEIAVGCKLDKGYVAVSILGVLVLGLGLTPAPGRRCAAWRSCQRPSGKRSASPWWRVYVGASHAYK